MFTPNEFEYYYWDDICKWSDPRGLWLEYTGTEKCKEAELGKCSSENWVAKEIGKNQFRIPTSLACGKPYS